MYEMEYIQISKELTKRVDVLKGDGKSIGFVPTMGALHSGHLSLIEEAKKQTDIIIVSIFVNPNQFNDPKDLEKYPRDIEKDVEKLIEVGCDILFSPTVEDIYPEEDNRQFDFGLIDKVMEGKHRPGHFNGVAQVVSRLFNIVNPDKAFFGMKDFQQIAIINEMVKQLKFNIEIVECPTIRELDGLAMSSRNLLLDDERRKIAPIIAQSLNESRKFAEKYSIKETIEYVESKINANELLDVEYFEIVDGNSLQAVNSWDDADYIVGAIAVFAGEVRLIDNVVYKKDR